MYGMTQEQLEALHSAYGMAGVPDAPPPVSASAQMLPGSGENWVRSTQAQTKPIRIRCTLCFEEFVVPESDVVCDLVDEWATGHPCDTLY